MSAFVGVAFVGGRDGVMGLGWDGWMYKVE